MSKHYPLNIVAYYDDFNQMTRELAKKYGERTAFTVYNRKGEKSEYSYIRLFEDADAFSKALKQKGLLGKHVAIVAENSYEWVVAYLGITAGGGAAVCIDYEQAEETIRNMIVESDSIAMVVTSTLKHICMPLMSRKGMSHMFVIGQDDDNGFEALLSEGRNIHDELKVQIDRKQTAEIVFTSGTMGKSKAVELSHYALLRNASDALAMVTSQRLYSFAMLPFYHTYGFTCAVLATLIGGYNSCINGDLKTMTRDMEYFKPELLMAVPLVTEALHKFVWSAIEKAGQKKKVNFFIKLGSMLGNPNLFLKSAIEEKFKGTALETLKVIVCGGAYLSESVAKDMAAFGVVVLQGYGITECGPLVSVNRNKDNHMGSVGTVVPGYEVKIKDEEILVRGESLMNGYYKDPELTNQSFDDGWFKTGDIGYFDKYGYLFIHGRMKNLIVMKNGKKISPEEIEAAVRANKLIKDVVAYGASSGDSADDVKLAIMVYPDPDVTKGLASYEVLEQLQQYVDTLNAQLPAYRQIQMINIRDQDFSRTATKKIIRNAI